jgi:ribonuclease E
VQVRGTRSLGQSILRIISEDAAKENTGEIHVYVPADVSSYLLNEKRRDIIAIENTYQVNILIIADPYKSRPYYKVARVKAVAGKKPFSYDMTPNSPEPSMDWRDINSNKKSLKPLVKVSVPPRMPKKKNKTGIFGFIKSILTLSIFKSKKKKNTNKRRNRNYKKGQQKTNKNTRNDRNQSNRNNRKNNKPNTTNQKKTTNKKTPKPVVIPPKNNAKADKKDLKSNETSKPSEDKVGNKAVIDSKNISAPTPAPTPALTPAPTPAPTPAAKPTRALNDPRYKSE